MINPSTHIATTQSLPRWQPSCLERLLQPRLATRMAAYLRRFKLDRALSEGADPSSSGLLAARAAQLAGQSTRADVATGLERMALSIVDPPSRTRVRPSRQAALANQSMLLDLAAALRRGGPLYARGIAKLRMIVVDGTGPAYTDRRGEALARALELAAAGLNG
jgi:hypothetical protein